MFLNYYIKWYIVDFDFVEIDKIFVICYFFIIKYKILRNDKKEINYYDIKILILYLK